MMGGLVTGVSCYMENRMKIQNTHPKQKSIFTKGGKVAFGEIVEVTKPVGEAFIKIGFATACKDKKKSK